MISRVTDLGGSFLLASSGLLPTRILNLLAILYAVSPVLTLLGGEGNGPRPSALLGLVNVVAHSAALWVSPGDTLDLGSGRVAC